MRELHDNPPDFIIRFLIINPRPISLMTAFCTSGGANKYLWVSYGVGENPPVAETDSICEDKFNPGMREN